jgi:hypothetical protein
VSNSSRRQSYWWYVPIVSALVLGYAAGGFLSFGVMFCNGIDKLVNPTARLVLILFGMGLLGSTMYCTKWWASDVEEAMKDKSLLPHLFDAFGYLTTIIGGGITGVVLYLAVKAGVMLAVTSTKPDEPRLAFALVIAFCGGLFHFKVRDMLSGVLSKLIPEHKEAAASKAPGEDSS